MKPFNVDDMRELSVAERAWAAGVIEGEGCIRIQVSSVRDWRTKKPLKDRATMSVVVGMKDGAVVRKLHAMFGGHINARFDGMHIWTASSNRAKWVLEQIVPWLIGDKLPQAKLALEFQLGRVVGHRKPERHEWELSSARDISAMKRIGVYDHKRVS